MEHLQPKETVMFTAKRNTAITTLAVSIAFALLAGFAAADTDPSNSNLETPVGLVGVAAAAAHGRVTGANGSTVQIRLTPVRGMGPGLADPFEQGDRTRVVVGMTDVPSDPANPSLIFEIHEGTCGDPASAPLYVIENTLGGYPPAPYYVGGTLPVSLAALRSGAYSISVRAGPDASSVELACGNMA
jgi:hypothetical protein